MIMALIFFRDPFQSGIFLEKLHCPICGTAIDYDVFDMRIILVGYALDGRLDGTDAVKAGCDNRDLRRLRHAKESVAGNSLEKQGASGTRVRLRSKVTAAEDSRTT